MAGRQGSPLRAGRQEQEAESSHLSANTGSRKTELEVSQGCTFSKLTPTDVLPPASLCLLKIL